MYRNIPEEILSTNPVNYKHFKDVGYPLLYLAIIQIRYYSLVEDSVDDWSQTLDSEWRHSSSVDEALMPIIYYIVESIRNLDEENLYELVKINEEYLIGLAKIAILPISHFKELRKAHGDSGDRYRASLLIYNFCKLLHNVKIDSISSEELRESLKSFSEFKF